MTLSTASHSQVPRFAAFQHHDFRALWIGQFISLIGTQMQNTALHWHVLTLLKDQRTTFNLLGQNFDLDAAALGLGTIGLTRIVPILMFSMIGGMMADTRNRRAILFWSQIVSAVVAGVMALATIFGVITIPLVYLLSAAISAAAAFNNPARQALIPNLVPREHLTNALSLGTISFNLGQVLGPALGGIVLAYASPGWAYAFNAVSFAAVIVAVVIMRHKGAPPANASPANLASMIDGFRFVRNSPMIWATMLLDFIATFFSSASTMLPIVVSGILGLTAEWYGVLSTGQAVGSVIASGVLSFMRGLRNQGKVILVAVGIYGLATIFFGLSQWFWLSYLFYAATGAADAVSTVIRGTIRQLMTPDNMRGRMMGVNMIFFMGGPQLGEIEAGLVAAAFGVPFSIVSGGIATVLLTIWIARRFPSLRNFDVAKL